MSASGNHRSHWASSPGRCAKYERPLKGSAVDAVEVQIRELLRETPTMPATVIAERIGWQWGMTILKERVRELRPAYLSVDQVSWTSGRSCARARFTVFFEMPRCRAIALIGICSARCSLRISAQSSAWITSSLLALITKARIR